METYTHCWSLYVIEYWNGYHILCGKEQVDIQTERQRGGKKKTETTDLERERGKETDRATNGRKRHTKTGTNRQREKLRNKDSTYSSVRCDRHLKIVLTVSPSIADQSVDRVGTT